MANSDRSESIRWIVVIVVTAVLGFFILTSKFIPQKYILVLAAADYAVFFFANYKLTSIRKKSREKETQVKGNRASRRQAERLKNK
jgi:hypothetical protein